MPQPAASPAGPRVAGGLPLRTQAALQGRQRRLPWLAAPGVQLPRAAGSRPCQQRQPRHQRARAPPGRREARASKSNLFRSSQVCCLHPQSHSVVVSVFAHWGCPASVSCMRAFAGVQLPEGWSVKTNYKKSGAVRSRVGTPFRFMQQPTGAFMEPCLMQRCHTLQARLRKPTCAGSTILDEHLAECLSLCQLPPPARSLGTGCLPRIASCDCRSTQAPVAWSVRPRQLWQRHWAWSLCASASNLSHLQEPQLWIPQLPGRHLCLPW